jgi:hypothetical protein
MSNRSSPHDSDAVRGLSPRARLVIGVVAVITGVSTLYYFGGFRQIFFYFRTPEHIRQPVVEAEMDAEQLSIPVIAHIFTNNEFLGSERDQDNARHLVENASNIWEQANIMLEIRDIITTEMPDDELALMQYRPREFSQGLMLYDPDAINVYLVKNLRGINGISYGGIRAVAVADLTTVYDFRALAHEIGHQLGLQHVDTDTLHLMSQGVNGIELEAEEIVTARRAVTVFNN